MMTVNAILLNAKDNVATCTAEVRKGDVVKCLGSGEEIQSAQDIPVWHKIALRPIGKGEKVFKYGEIIGETLTDIPQGGWVSHENIFSVPRDYSGEYV